MDYVAEPRLADLTSVLETALDAVVVMREDGVVSGWNNIAEQIFGWSRDEALGRQLSELIIPERFREAHHKGLTTYLETGHGPVLNSHIEVCGLRRSGEEFPVELSIAPTSIAGERRFLSKIR
jgi:PAS domain S-box-containing protein